MMSWSFRILGDLIKSGVLSVPLGIRSSLESSGQTDQILPTDLFFYVNQWGAIRPRWQYWSRIKA